MGIVKGTGIQAYQCDKHLVMGYNRLTCPYCEDKENTYTPLYKTDGKTSIVFGVTQVKKAREK
jgi:hypothetical protein